MNTTDEWLWTDRTETQFDAEPGEYMVKFGSGTIYQPKAATAARYIAASGGNITAYAVRNPNYVAPAPAPDFADYDAGLLNDFGGGNVEWWQDYLRAEIGRANDFWRSQTAPAPVDHMALLRQ